MTRGTGLVLAALALALLGCSSDEGGTVPELGWETATALTEQEDHAQGIATDGTVAVFATGGSLVGENALRVVPLDGSAPSRILVKEPLGSIPSRALTLVDGTVYVAVGNSVAAVPLAGGPATPVVTGRPATISSVAVDGTHLYWTTSQLNVPEVAEIGRIALSGGAAEVLADHVVGHGSYTSVVADGSGGAYGASPGGIVHAVPGGPPELVVSAEETSGAVTRIALDADRLYGAVAGGRNDLFSVPLSGGPVTQLAEEADNTGAVLAVDGGVAYFVDDDVRWVPGTGGEAVTLASGRYADGTLAATGDRLVFPADWRIWTVPLPG